MHQSGKKDGKILGPVAAPEQLAADGPLNPAQARFFFVIFILSILLLGGVLWPFWQLLILAFLLAGIFRPIYSRLLAWMSPWLASLLTCGLIVLIVFIPLTFCIGALSTETLSLLKLVKDTHLLNRLQEFLQNNTLMREAQEVLAGVGINFAPTDLTGTVSKYAGLAGLFIYNQATLWAGNIMSFVMQFCILILVVYFLLIEIDRLLMFLMKLSPLPDDQDRLLLQKFMEIAGAILVVNCISGLFQGLMGGLYFYLFDLKSPVLWGSVMAVVAFLPIFGIGMVLIPASLILLLNGQTVLAAMTFIFYVILSFSVEYLLKPKFVGDHVKMHALLVFLAILGGMSVFGVLGIIYGPLIVTGFLTLSDLYVNVYAKNNEKYAGGGPEATSREAEASVAE